MRFPNYTEFIKTTDLLYQINQRFPKIEKGEKNSTNVYSSVMDLTAMNAYLMDHEVDILHVGTRGTFRAGLDRSNLNLPKPKGTGKFRVRQKDRRDSLTIQFCVLTMEFSGFSLESDADLLLIKNSLTL